MCKPQLERLRPKKLRFVLSCECIQVVLSSRLPFAKIIDPQPAFVSLFIWAPLCTCDWHRLVWPTGTACTVLHPQGAITIHTTILVSVTLSPTWSTWSSTTSDTPAAMVSVPNIFLWLQKSVLLITRFRTWVILSFSLSLYLTTPASVYHDEEGTHRFFSQIALLLQLFWLRVCFQRPHVTPYC
jgi:hypothetical protein